MEKWKKLIITVLVAFAGGCCIYLFYNQALGVFPSDLGAHIAAALDSGNLQYTITKPVFRFVFRYMGGNLGIAVFLSAIIVITFFATKRLLDFYLDYEEKDSFEIYIIAILLNFVLAVYIPFIHGYWNVGVQEPTEWHNSTYIIMKLFGMAALLLYFKIEEKYLSGISKKDWILFCIYLTITNSVKPNFILAFAPAMLFFLIIDFSKHYRDRHAVANMIIFGCAVLVSLTVLLWQSYVLYGQETGDGIRIGFADMLSRWHRWPLISLIQSAAFPLFILISNIKEIFGDKKHLFAWIMNGIALAQYLFLHEIGSRVEHGNFDFGYSFTLMLVFASSISIIYKQRKNHSRSKLYFASGYLLFTLHAAAGMIYFIKLLRGGSYY